MQLENVKKQKMRLKNLKKKVSKARSRAQSLIKHTKSSSFWAAVHGGADFLDPVVSRADYMARYEHVRKITEPAIAELLKEAETLPASSGQRWNKRRNTKIGIIADQFLYQSLEVAANFYPITPENYESVIENVDLLLVVTAWRGLDEEWTGFANPKSQLRALVEKQVIPLARSKNVPVAFYSKEDPPNYKQFLSLADQADFVFTSAEEMIPQYEKDLSRKVPIESLRFGVNYELHNPLGCLRHSGHELVFAGSWMAHKYPERSEAGEKIFDGILDAGVPFFAVDRNLHLDPKKFKNLERYMYPEKYLTNLHAPIDHESLQRLQKLLPLAVNLNSVVKSQTMFANRIVELLAMGTLILSNHSAGVNSRYPYVQILDSRLDTEQFLRTLTPEYTRFCQSEGIRDVFLNDTAFDRIDQILAAVGIEHQEEQHRVLVVCDDEAQFESFRMSQATDFPLTFVDAKDTDKVMGQLDGDIVLFPDKIGFNSPDIVNDSIAAFRYSAVDALTFSQFDNLKFSAYSPTEGNPGQSHSHAIWLNAGETLSEIKVNSFMGVLTSASQKEIDFSKTEPEISIVIPTYNNGKHLVHKCVQSICRSSIYAKAEILIIDDGSTDTKTAAAVDLLEQSHSNVRVFRFGDGGSGSASRPRNKGLELARAPYVTYLDPDNEQVNDGFSVLLDMVRKDGSDFAIGNMIRFKGYRSVVNNARFLRNAIAKSPKFSGYNQELLKKLEYKPMSIQALVANVDWLRSTGISQPVGAVGQDSYFFQQMLFYARKISITTLPIHIYYAEVANSTVNTISPNFYRKYLPLERDRSEWLKQVGLFEHYASSRFTHFLEHWYIEKLKYTSSQDAKESIELIEQLASFYTQEDGDDSKVSSLIQQAKETIDER